MEKSVTCYDLFLNLLQNWIADQIKYLLPIIKG